MIIKIPWSFEKQFPLLSGWLDLRITWARRLPEKVKRSEVPRGELYPLTRDKTLFALTQAIQPMLKFKLKDLVNQLSVSYDTIRHWAKEERVRDKTREYAQQFVDYFMNELIDVIKALERDESEESAWDAMKLENLREEATNFSGLIQELFFDALIIAFENAPTDLKRVVRLNEFVDRLLWHAKYHNIRSTKLLHNLSGEVSRVNLQLWCNYLEHQISVNPAEAISDVQYLKSHPFSILRRVPSLELPHYEMSDKHQKTAAKRKKATTGKRDPVDERKKETN